MSPSATLGSSLLRVLLLGSLLLVASLLAGLAFGPGGWSVADFADAISGTGDPTPLLVLQELRLPRVILAAHAGAVLALGGLAFQAVLRNPLAEPYTLGVSGGAAVGTIAAVLLGLSPFFRVCTSFAGGLATLALVLYLGGLRGNGSTGRDSRTLLLAGVMITAFCSAVIMLLVSLARGAELTAVIHWLMGDLGSATPSQALTLSLGLLPGYIVLLWASHGMNLLSLGQETARSLGVDVRLLILILLAVISAMVGGLVSVIGPIGFVGLVAPQALRLIFGPDQRVLAPACLLFGASYMIGCDLLARCLPTQGELPTGVITAVIGAPAFIFLLRRKP